MSVGIGKERSKGSGREFITERRKKFVRWRKMSDEHGEADGLMAQTQIEEVRSSAGKIKDT